MLSVPETCGALPEPHRIALGNEARIAGEDALIANLTPFRAPSADVGAAFELGLMRGLGRPVFGWTTDVTPFAVRTRAALACSGGDGLSVEDFGLHDNLMIEGTIAASSGLLVAENAAEGERWNDLRAFKQCVIAAARLLRRNTFPPASIAAACQGVP